MIFQRKNYAVWYDSLHDITPNAVELFPCLLILILLLLSLTWIVSVYRIWVQIYDAYCEMPSPFGDSDWRSLYDKDGRQLIRLQRAYNRLVDHYERAKFDDLSQFVDTNGFMLCFLFSLASGMVGKSSFCAQRQWATMTTTTNLFRISPN